MTDETPSELAKRLWDTALEHLSEASNATDVGVSDAYVRVGELALKAAQFAINNQAFLMGVPSDQYGLPPGAPPLPAHLQGPKVWGHQ